MQRVIAAKLTRLTQKIAVVPSGRKLYYLPFLSWRQVRELWDVASFYFHIRMVIDFSDVPVYVQFSSIRIKNK
jgi:hypothetical protein